MATEIQKVQHSARDLVARSRLGDQNATAMIIAIRESAKQGSKRAIYTIKYLTDYIKKHPITMTCNIGFGCDPMTQRVINSIHSKMGADPSRHAPIMISRIPKIKEPSIAAVPLANCGSLIKDGDANPRITAICSFFGDAEMDAYLYGEENCFLNTDTMHADMSPKEQCALHIGKAIGIAKRIQIARQPGSRVSVLSRMAGWELGE